VCKGTSVCGKGDGDLPLLDVGIVVDVGELGGAPDQADGRTDRWTMSCSFDA
jgi:hypothetical protein